MLGEDEAVDDPRSFKNASIKKRMAIVLAGIIVNLLFGFITFWVLASIYNHNILDGLKVTGSYLVKVVNAFASLFTSGVKEAEVVGPVGISSMIVGTSSLFDFIYLMAVISVSLGVTNMLPIPGLDGGKFVLLVIEAIRKKPLSEEVELNLTAVGLFILLTIAFFVTTKDISKIF